MTILVILAILSISATIGGYLIWVGKKIAKSDQADEILDAVGDIHKMEREQTAKTADVIEKGVVADPTNVVANAFPRVQSPNIRRGARAIPDSQPPDST